MFPYAEASTITTEGARLYRVPGGLYPSITTILGRTMDERKSKALHYWRKKVGKAEAERIRAEAAVNGNALHAMQEASLAGEPPPDLPGVSLDVMVAAEQLEALFEGRVSEVWGQEVALWSDRLKAAGRADLVCVLDGRPAVVDYKTARKPRTRAQMTDAVLQSAFYAIAHNEMFGTAIDRAAATFSHIGGKTKEVSESVESVREALEGRIRAYRGQAKACPF